MVELNEETDGESVTAPVERDEPAMAAPAEPRPGDELLGRFRVERRLGAGSTGVVFEVTDLATGERLALKALRAPRPHRARLLKAEFRAVRDLAHRRLVTVHELFVDGERAFMTMDLVRGVPLTFAVRAAARDGRWESVRHLFGQCGDGLLALHEHGRLHRDLKPSNVLASDAGEVTILDFGLASEASARRGAGTRLYMAPEQLAGAPATPASDWYAVGLMLYEGLSGSSARDIPRGGEGADGRTARALEALPAGAPTELVELCRSMLAVDPAGRPSGANVIGVLRPRDARHAARRARFVGRDAELRALRGALAAVQRDGARCVLVRGEAGTGKTRLTRELVREARDRGTAMVLRASCSQYEHVAFNALDGIVDGLGPLLAEQRSTFELGPDDAHRVAGLFPSLGPSLGVDPASHADASGPLPRVHRQAAMRSFRSLLAALAAERPTILWIDDVQWADADSLELLRAVLAVRPQRPLLLLGCARSGPRESELESLVASSAWHGQLLELGPLSHASAVQMAADALGEPPSHLLARRIATEGQGHPLLMEQLVALGETEPATTTLDRALGSRLERLPSDERELIELLSAHGRPLARDLATELAGARGGRMLLKNLCVRSLCLWDDGAIDTYHGKIREAVYGHLAPDQRRSHHRTLYDLLAAREGTPSWLLAEHARAAELHREAFEHFCDAAGEARRGHAHHRAARLLRSALELPIDDLGEERRAQVRERLAVALVAAGRGVEAAEQYLELASRGDPAQVPGHRCRAAEQLLLSGRTTEGFRVLDGVLETLDVRVPRTTAAVLASLLANRALLRFPRRPVRRPSLARLHRVDALAAGASGHIVTDTLRGAWFAARQLHEAERTGDSARIVRALVYEAMYLANEGAANGVPLARVLERARVHARLAGDVESDALLGLAEGLGALLLGRWTEGAAGLRRAEQKLADPACERWFELNLSRKLRSISLWFTGTAAELERSIGVWLDDARERGDDAAIRSFSTELPLVALLGDRPDEAHGHIVDLEQSSDPRVFDESRVVSLHNQMHHALYTGARPERLVELARAIQPLWRSLLGRGQLLRVTSRFYVGQVLLAASLTRGGSRSLLRRVRRTARRLEREGAPYPRLYAGLLESAVRAQRGERHAARRLLAEVAADLADDGQRLYAAGARWRLGELEGGARGRALVEDAHRTMHELGVVCPERCVSLLATGFPGGA